MPKEINRMVTDSIVQLFFVREPAGGKNRLREGHGPDAIRLVGNVMIDSLLANQEKAVSREKWRQYQLPKGGYALMTLHRPANVDSPARLRELQHGLLANSGRVPLIFLGHPRTHKNLDHSFNAAALVYYAPLGYMDFVSLMAGPKLIVTDSGGTAAPSPHHDYPSIRPSIRDCRPVV